MNLFNCRNAGEDNMEEEGDLMIDDFYNGGSNNNNNGSNQNNSGNNWINIKISLLT